MKGISAGGQHSFTDFGLFINSRNIGLPEKKEIRETVPYMNGFFDFSALSGEVAFGEREISYVFDVAEATIVEMQEVKDNVLHWLLNIQDTEIYDDYIPDYYFHGSSSGSGWTEEAEQGELTAKFIVQPYMYARSLTSYSWTVTDTLTVTVTNESSHLVMPTITTTGNLTIAIGTSSYVVGAGTYQSSDFMLPRGNISMTLTGTCDVTFSYRREVF